MAISDFPLLTLERAHKVCRYVMDRINSMGGRLDGYFLRPHANHDYAERYGDRYRFREELVCECGCIKLGVGMVLDALKAEGGNPDDLSIYVIGDRATDVETALNIGGAGILIPFENQPGEDEKTKRLPGRSRIRIARDLLGAAEFIIEDVRS